MVHIVIALWLLLVACGDSEVLEPIIPSEHPSEPLPGIDPDPPPACVGEGVLCYFAGAGDSYYVAFGSMEEIDMDHVQSSDIYALPGSPSPVGNLPGSLLELGTDVAIPIWWAPDGCEPGGRGCHFPVLAGRTAGEWLVAHDSTIYEIGPDLVTTRWGGVSADEGPIYGLLLPRDDQVWVEYHGVLTIFDATGIPILTKISSGTDGPVLDQYPFADLPMSSPGRMANAGDGTVFIVDQRFGVIWSVDPVTWTATRVAGRIRDGVVLGSVFTKDGTDALEADLYFPTGLAVRASGELVFSEYGNNCIRKVGADGRLWTVAGVCTEWEEDGTTSGEGGPAEDAVFSGVWGNISIVDDQLYILANDATYRVDLAD